ncbi:hypothetical protein JCM14635_00800 [Megalodesulfovibrio paquesii]
MEFLCQCIYIFWLHKKSIDSILDDIRNAAHSRSYQWFSAGHGFNKYPRHSLCSRRHGKNITSLHGPRHLIIRYRLAEFRPRHGLNPGPPLTQLWFPSMAHDDEPRIRMGGFETRKGI